MATFGEIAETIADRLSRDDLTSQIYAAINRAIRYYSNQRFWFNVDNANISVLANTDRLYLNSITDFRQETEVDGFFLYYNQLYYPLKKIKKAEYDIMNSESTGIPRYYAWVDGVYKIYPFADRDYDLQVNYIKTYAKMTKYADTNGFTENAEDLIAERAIADIYLNIEHEPEIAGIHRQVEGEEYQRLLDFTRQKTASGELMIHDEIGI